MPRYELCLAWRLVSSLHQPPKNPRSTRGVPLTTTRRENATAVELLSDLADAHDAVGLDVANDGLEVLNVTLGPS